MIAKLAAPPLSAWLIAVFDSQPYFVVGAFVLTVIFGWRAFKVRDFNAEIESLKSAVNTAEIVKTTEMERRVQLQEQLHGAETRARGLELEVQQWKAAHDALKPYSAGPAFEKLETLITQTVQQADQRHRETIDLIRLLAGEKSVGP